MSTVERGPTTDTMAVRGPTTDDFTASRWRWGETKLFARTSEFWMTLAGLAALVLIYNFADDPSLDLWRACLLGTVIGVAYIVSRGIAKAGTYEPRMGDAGWRDRDVERRI